MSRCIPRMTADAAAALSALRAELEQAKRERDAAVECIQFIVTYLELNSMKDIRKTIEAWKSGLKEGVSMERTLSIIVDGLNRLNDDNLAERVIRNNDVQWSLSELQDILDVIGDMPVDRLRALAQADREGRCVVLPAKTVFEITWDAGPDCDLACPVSVDTHGDCSFCDHGKQFVYERTCKQECIDQIGKTVFLTREEAEKALGGGGDG